LGKLLPSPGIPNPVYILFFDAVKTSPAITALEEHLSASGISDPTFIVLKFDIVMVYFSTSDR
jgi:hypothetical protein